MNATYAPTQSSSTRHPQGGYLTCKATPNGLGLYITDTRRFQGKRRSVKAVVYQVGCEGWAVVFNPGPNAEHAGRFLTGTADAAYEAALNPMK